MNMIALNDTLKNLNLPQRLAAIAKMVEGPLVFTTSLGIEDQLITHHIATQNLPIKLVTLDTGRLFPQTYDVWQATEEKYGRRIQAMFPQAAATEALVADQGINGFYYAIEMRKACCHVRKVEPLNRALSGAKGWVTGLRGGQSANRDHLVFAEEDAARGLIKFNPLADYTREQVVDEVKALNVPYNVLHDQGFLSIGCAPCTRALKPGEPERAGRWWWEDEANKECGLHVAEDGSLVRAKETA